ncbi:MULTISPECIES: TerC family protein [unclassified Pseudomonas]|uniref:TerC family protein n=1 Tax=unclassified Pseudomonas TaxID=196821 RepID=UPI00119C721E|nr:MULTISPECIES: TerC family protein [unclassified Pseudomonas]TWC16869.1 putative tellurium resistance membrane protein TerC [Pseudomonas sp. SJZ075]TWC25912.1 putative tellurium resistance membrane protein TerC [Pseudomonas sp. SJZ074]TWC32915.1 putative tellurium resistance membrane protein TerC [Pseudomonas sp. SJZ078]TWC42723.1 putative tellurium resistance membrane protein TerC [Pseudomonas sp. SJZ085]TWC53792.1 putative tellurium resistance membrane protein TerC [Pseudomonas sp. SJZ124]
MEWIVDPTAWLGLLTLIVLELVLGIDNLVFIAILADKLPPEQRDRARIIGLSLALLMRLGLLASISWMVTLTEPLFEVFDKMFSGRDLIMLFGGVFLLFKATMELHERLEGHVAQRTGRAAYAMFWPIVAQIVVLDAVFSLDAVITAVGMVEHLSVMMIAVIFSIGLMIIASKPLTRFVNGHPTVIMLCLGFLMMIGFSLTAEGLGFHIPKGYLYAAIGFSILIELFNQLARSRRKKSLQGRRPMRQRTAHAVMRLLGGHSLDADEVGEEIADMLASDEVEPAFDRRERVMISGVLQLAERPIRGVMTPRAEIDHLDLADTPDVIRTKLMHSSYSRLPLIRDGQVDEPLGFVHKKELLKELLAGHEPDLGAMARKAVNLLDSFTILNALEQMRKESTHIAFVVNEFGDFVGLLTMTDILESIAGELPDASEIEGPNILAQEGGFLISGALNLSQIREQTGFQAQATDDYQTLAGLVMSLLDRLPVIGDELHWQAWSLRVVEVQERRVTRVLLRPDGYETASSR